MKKKFLHFYFFLFLFFLALVTKASIPPGYYDNAEGLSGLPLKTALYNIIKGHTSVSYDQLWTSFQSTDKKTNGKVWDMYSDNPGSIAPYEFSFVTNQCGNYTTEGDCYNREHSFPSSWFGGSVLPMYTDLFHLIPTDGYVNNRRSNYPLSDVETATWTSLNGSMLGTCSDLGYSGVVFEPIDSFKGDFARSFFYMATRYENIIASWYSNSSEADVVLSNNSELVFEPWYINMLLHWCNIDPVSQKEKERNEAVYTIQNNRNPYIDHPEWIENIWGNSVDVENSVSVSFKINVFPVPSSGKITITSNEKELHNVTIQVYSLEGKQIFKKYENVLKETIFDFPESGIYFIKFIYDKGIEMKKVCIQKK